MSDKPTDMKVSRSTLFLAENLDEEPMTVLVNHTNSHDEQWSILLLTFLSIESIHISMCVSIVLKDEL